MVLSHYNVFECYLVHRAGLHQTAGLNPRGFGLSQDEHLSQLGHSHASTPHTSVVAQFKGAEELSRREIKMSELSSEANPQILVNGEQQGDAAAAEEQISSARLDQRCSEDNVAAEKETQAKMQSVFQQVRNQIRSQVGVKASKSGLLELMQRVKDREMLTAQVSGAPEGEEVSSEEEKQADVLTDESKCEMDPKQELCALFEEKLEASKKTLRDEFDVQISQVRAEMRAYTDQALKDLECKMHSRQPDRLPQLHPKEQHQSKGPDKKKASAPPSLASRRGRVLTRTMTTIIPKTCAPVIVGPRAKSETLSSSKGEISRLHLRDAAHLLPGNKPCQSRKPLLPPTWPPLHQHKKPVRAKAKTGN